MLTFVPANAQHIGARAEQQDSFGFSNPANKSLVSHGGFVGVVADGMGGLEGGRQASSAAVKTFLDSYGRKQKNEAIPLALRRALVDANSAVLGVSRRLGGDKGTGTTLIAFALHNTSLYWVSAGDSRLYLLRRGELSRINADHTQRNFLLTEVANGRIDRDAALNDRQGSHLTSYLGLPEVPIIDLSLRAFPLMKDDVIVACSDGVYRGVSEEEMIAAFQRGSAATACEAMQALTLAKRNAAQDNLTVIAVECRAEEPDTLQMPPVPPRSHGSRLVLAGVLALEALVAGGLLGNALWPRRAHAKIDARAAHNPHQTPKIAKSTKSPDPPKAPKEQEETGVPKTTPAPPENLLPTGAAPGALIDRTTQNADTQSAPSSPTAKKKTPDANPAKTTSGTNTRTKANSQ